ncbi:MAG: hypothetical protein QOI16_2936, partial [Pseudonocardiales bacterium]|nr:hypothetical protein [Pseudonocardiales bacterium]
MNERYWSIVTVPVLGDQGATVWLLNRVDDVTAYVADRVVRGKVEDGRDRVEHGEAQVHPRARDFQFAWAAEADANRRVAALTGVAVAASSAQTVEEITRLVIERGLAALGADRGGQRTAFD